MSGCVAGPEKNANFLQLLASSPIQIVDISDHDLTDDKCPLCQKNSSHSSEYSKVLIEEVETDWQSSASMWKPIPIEVFGLKKPLKRALKPLKRALKL